MTETFRNLGFAALAVGLFTSVSVAPAHGSATCALPQLERVSRSVDLEGRKKLDREEFGNLPILPAKSALLTAGTALNAVVDLACLRDPSRGAQKLDWLRALQSQAPEGKGLRSFPWKLERDWDFFVFQGEIEAEPCLQMVSPERRYRLLSVFHDPYANEQGHLAKIGFDTAIRSFLLPMMTRPKAVLAVIDTGVDFDHPDLNWNRWVNSGEVEGNGVDDDRDGYADDADGYNFASGNSHTGPEGDWPDNKHGTHVAGLAAGRLDNGEGGTGVAGVAKIMSLNVFGDSGYSRSSILENAIRYAADHDADVINMSLGGREYSRTMQSALEYAIRKGSFIVTAAGNDGVELCDDPMSFEFVSPAVYASSLQGMISVGSTDTVNGRFSTFSNYSPRFVEIAAPGAFSSSGTLMGLLSSVPGGKYGYLAGTSMSAPVVSGAAILAITWLKTYRYPISPGMIETIMKNGSRSQSILGDAVQDGRTLDLNSLSSYLRSNYPAR